jgi:hypothetical protein
MISKSDSQSGNAGTGARVGDGSNSEQGRDAGGAGQRGGQREENQFDMPKRRGPAGGDGRPAPKSRPKS